MRSTEDKLLHIPFVAGMNQANSPRLAATGTLYSVRNCRVSGNGVLEKRPGSAALTITTIKSPTHSFAGDGSATNVEKPSFACQVQGALMVGNTYGDAFAYSTAWQFQGRFSTCRPLRKRYGLAVDDRRSLGFGTTPPDMTVTASGYLCVCATTSAPGAGAACVLHLYIEDPNGVRIYYKNDATDYTRVRVISVGDVVYLITQATGSTSIQATLLTIAAGVVTTTAAVGMDTLAASDDFWDVSGYNANEWYIAYQSAAAVITLERRLGTGSPLASATFACVGKPPITVWADTSRAQAFVGFYDDPAGAGDVAFTVWDISGGGATAIASVRAKSTLVSAASTYGPPMFGLWRGVAVSSSVTKPVFYCFRQYSRLASAAAATMYGTAYGSATANSTPVACWHVLPIGKPDNYHRVWCAVADAVAPGVAVTTRMLLLRFASPIQVPPTPPATPPTIELCSPSMLLGDLQNQGLLNSTWFSSSCTSSALLRSFGVVPIVFQTLEPGAAAESLIRFDVYEYTCAELDPHRGNSRFGVTTTIAGQPVELWGQSVSVINNSSTSSLDAGAWSSGASEVGFPHAPLLFSITKLAGTGGLSAGAYNYKVVFEWIDLYGRRHQSPPSAPLSITVAAGDGARIVIGSLDASQRQAPNIGLRAYLRVYRTVANGVEYHELLNTAQAFSTASGQITFNDTSENDAGVGSNGAIYTDGGVLPHDLAPSCSFTSVSEERMWFGGLWDSTIVQCSKVIVPQEPIQCTDDASHQVQLPAPCTGLAYMDGNVVAFTADAIYLISGDGPNDQGAGSFPPPRALTRSVGCCDYRSIVQTNIGVIFQGNIGFYLLPRGFGPVQYLGVAVQDEMVEAADVSQVVLGSVSHMTRDNHVVRYLVASPGATATTRVLTFDIDAGAWFRDSLPFAASEIGAFDSLQSTGYKGAVFIRENLATSVAGSEVLVETPSTKQDGGVDYQQYVQTSWIHPFGLGGWGKVNCVMIAVEALGASQQLTLQVEVDDQPAESGVWTITAPGAVSYRALYLSNRACTSVRVTVLGDTTADNSGFKFISCTLEIEPTSGLRLMQDSEKN